MKHFIIPLIEKLHDDLEQNFPDIRQFSYNNKYYITIENESLPNYDDLQKKGIKAYGKSNYTEFTVPSFNISEIFVDTRLREFPDMAESLCSRPKVHLHQLYFKLVNSNIEENQKLFGILQKIKVISSYKLSGLPIFQVTPIPKGLSESQFSRMCKKYFPELQIQNLAISDGSVYCLMKNENEVTIAINCLDNGKINDVLISAKAIASEFSIPEVKQNPSIGFTSPQTNSQKANPKLKSPQKEETKENPQTETHPFILPDSPPSNSTQPSFTPPDFTPPDSIQPSFTPPKKVQKTPKSDEKSDKFNNKPITEVKQNPTIGFTSPQTNKENPQTETKKTGIPAFTPPQKSQKESNECVNKKPLFEPPPTLSFTQPPVFRSPESDHENNSLTSFASDASKTTHPISPDTFQSNLEFKPPPFDNLSKSSGAHPTNKNKGNAFVQNAPKTVFQPPGTQNSLDNSKKLKHNFLPS
ncbi:hypothetical protein TRFO_27144 [Tritrichomonas foetus]|uniref:Uncharacterized protein n=1 Tax=Tritrichomonas foetus TaxID=1144522 RepID=A0A1J4K1E7_9EUKA|nr:hypothetical protein TRFO_27144 [Tritrichomonas foetus]|eukprot:OHT05207.1 hypothetical protein TRFO_27144 [Tritrichomonas foetus]